MELREGQRTNASVSLTTASGNPVAYEKGSEKWESSDPDVVLVTPHADDPLQAYIDGKNGADNTAVVVKFTCDGDLNADQVQDIVATLDVVCTQGEAFVAKISTGPVTDTPV